MIEAVVARTADGRGHIEQTEVVVVTDRANGGVGQVRELGDLHASIVRCDVTSQSRIGERVLNQPTVIGPVVPMNSRSAPDGAFASP